MMRNFEQLSCELDKLILLFTLLTREYNIEFNIWCAGIRCVKYNRFKDIQRDFNLVFTELVLHFDADVENSVSSFALSKYVVLFGLCESFNSNFKFVFGSFFKKQPHLSRLDLKIEIDNLLNIHTGEYNRVHLLFSRIRAEEIELEKAVDSICT